MIKLNKIKYFVFIVILFTLVSPVFVLAQTPEEEQQIDLLYGEQNNNLPSSNPFNQIIPYQPTVSQNSPTRTSCYDTIDDIGDVICRIGSLLNAIVPVLVALGVVYFVWGVVQYVVGDNEEAKKKGRDRVIFGIIGLALIIGLWGIVSLVINTFDIGQNISVVNPSSAVILDTDS
ncbi:pilin, partial [Candidatus Nomurabacteria bacterium]|nr:pilin [Candidatus Nomurabacteria bacterium]